MKKRLTALLIVLSCILTGCGDTGTENDSNGEKELTVLVYGYIDAYSHTDLDSEIKEQIVKFNRSQDEYFIEIKKYGEDSYTDGLSALNAEMAAGKGPDIIQIDESLYREYAAKGTIVDLYSFMDADSDIQREDFFESVLKQYEVDGKLYALVPFFTINTCIGNPHHLSSDCVTFDEMCRMMEEEEEITVFHPLTRESVLWRCLDPELSAFVDWENGTCNFEKEDFIRIVEFANRFESIYETASSQSETEILMLENKVSIVYQPIIGFDVYAQYKSLFGGEAYLIGFPTLNGSKPRISSNYSYLTINAKSKEKEAAWELLKSFLSNQFLLSEDNKYNGFPITKTAFELRAEKSMKNYSLLDENGNVVEALARRGTTDTAGNTIWYDVAALTEEDIAYLKKVIDNAEVLPDDSEVASIVYEELEDYWSGIKSAEDVAAVIQNRVTNYLQEIL